jgi:rod shape-determining protein MreC
MSGKKVKSSSIIRISRRTKALIKRAFLLLLFFIAIAGIFISKNNSPFSDKVRTAVLDWSAPIIDWVAIPFHFSSNLAEALDSYLFVHEKNKELELENTKLFNKLVNLSGVVYENERLKRLLNYIETKDYKYISAKVVGSTSGPFYDSVIINVGQNDNVKKGQAVVSEEGLVGRIIEVGEKSSRILLISDINSNIPVIGSQFGERSIMAGSNNELPRLMHLPDESKSAEGEIVLTSGDGDMYPPGLQVGTIHIDSKGVKHVQPFAKRYQLEHLSIIDYSG